MNFKEWHSFMKNDQYTQFRRDSENDNPDWTQFQSDFSHLYQEKYIHNHPLMNKIYNVINDSFDNLEKFRKETFY